MFLFRDKRIPLNREFRSAIQCIWSVGIKKSLLISSKLGLSFPFFMNNLNYYNFSLCFFLLKNLTLSEVRIKRTIAEKINDLISMECYKGSRHRTFLPVRGQRTRTNSGTMRFLRSHKERVLWKN